MVDDSNQRIALGVIVAFPVLGGIAMLLRFWGRYLSRSALQSDDYFIIMGYILGIGQAVTMWYYVKTNYTGIHFWDIPKDYDRKEGLIWNFATQLLYNPCLTMVKISLLLFFRRLESRSRLINSLIWGTLAFTIALFFAVLFVDIFQCSPVAYVYDQSISGGQCINQGAFYVSTAALNLFTDFLVVSIPILITWSLHMPIRRKIAVCVILCMGGVATVIGIWRLVILAKGFFPSSPPTDPTYDIGFCSSAVEVHVAVMAACAPSMKAIVSKYIPHLLGTSRNGGTSRYGTASASNRFRSGYGHSRPKSKAGDAFELAGPYRAAVDPTAEEREMRKYRRGDSPSLSSEEGGIVKTTDVEVQYSPGHPHSHVEEGRAASVDSLV
ncbi:hypothetical protein BDV25DRAFT_170263 [Aspergillus avenaceus]|uniref:Rhodopsin domain-containing protein n=1 Tax=Aspergillus avenaceus TaxID=36643 RepID=A0A5N6THF9_ASPAV|nr:hypothetical protein BDV25DRAFT_170263 [Aspergillus avenaceus]